MERKGLSLELKQDGAEEGAVTAIFSTFNVIDKDGDVTLPGAFEDAAPVIISAWGHAWEDLPVGSGAIKADPDRALLDGRFFMDTTHGLDTYRTIKGLAGLQEWSYGYDVLDSEDGQLNGQSVRFLKKLHVYEVSPVMVGAGIGTGTLDMKSLSYQEVLKSAEGLRAGLDAVVARTRDRVELLTKEGRVLSAANRDRLATLTSTMRESLAEVEKLLAETDPGKASAAVLQEYVRYQKIVAELAAA
jgi:HK97 family phage prohead protease